MATLLIVIALAYIGLCALLFFFQRSFIYFPQPSARAADASTIVLASDDAQVLIRTRPRTGRKAVIYFGGNAEDVSTSLPSISSAFPEHAVYMMHYRGYGGSSGTPSESALITDAIALFDRVRTEHESVTVVGRSLGSGVAVRLASVRTVSRLILVTPYNSIQELAERQFPYFPIRWLLQDKFESWRYAERVSASTLVIAAEHDEVIPFASTKALYARFKNGVAKLAIIKGVDHNTISDSPAYISMLGAEP